MSNSVELLKKIMTINENFAIYLNDIINYKSSIDQLTNEYKTLFKDKDHIIEEYEHIYDDKSFKDLIHIITGFNDKLASELYQNCSHDFVNDLVDIDPDRSAEITYCVKCELHKKD
jgi:hypothetical protein